MSNEVKRVKDIMVELMLTGRVEFFEIGRAHV